MASSSSSRHNIPVVDMGALGMGKEEDSVSPAEWRRVAQGLCDALSSVGFVYLSNHGIHDQQINEYFNDCASFFKLDEQTKMKYRTAKNVAHGYMDVGREQLDVTGKFSEIRESYYVKDEAGVFPDSEVPQLRASATAFMTTCRALAYRVLNALALGLGLDRDFFAATHRGMCTNSPPNFTVLRINHYPPLPAAVPDNVIRCGAHTDYGSITLLFQDSMGGLQVRNVDGEWVDAEPIPGTILVNAGDLLQVWMANKLKATEHRVIIPKEEVRQRVSRYSAAFFAHPDNDVLVQPIDGSTDPPPITAGQHLLNMYDKTYQN